MGAPKKKELESDANEKIQDKFDLIFSDDDEKPSNSNATRSTVFNNEDNFETDNFQFDEDTSMSNSAQKKTPDEKSSPKMDLNSEGSGINLEFDSMSADEEKTAPESDTRAKLAVVPSDDDLAFSLDFGDDSPEEVVSAKTASIPKTSFEIPEIDESANEIDMMFEEAASKVEPFVPSGTQKTIVFDSKTMEDVEAFSFDDEPSSSADLMSKEETNANIETTIKDILRPRAEDSTKETLISSLESEDTFSLDDEVVPAAKNAGTRSIGTTFSSSAVSNSSATGEFDLTSVEFGDKEDHVTAVNEVPPMATAVKNEVKEAVKMYNAPAPITDEDSTRVHATIRQLREEREELLGQIKSMKGSSRELEQDNLTLKAALDESRIEVAILRKRHMSELEDMKYRLSLNDEKKEQALEKARLAEMKREKLEQRVRIDFNQVKQREKELETKLEMLTIDVDSQVHSRDQKILELRRKIDSLEFNMENVSIREQKSNEDKIKLEDKLNKMMKTLRHSIRNIEEDIDQVVDSTSSDKENMRGRTGKV